MEVLNSTAGQFGTRVLHLSNEITGLLMKTRQATITDQSSLMKGLSFRYVLKQNHDIWNEYLQYIGRCICIYAYNAIDMHIDAGALADLSAVQWSKGGGGFPN